MVWNAWLRLTAIACRLLGLSDDDDDERRDVCDKIRKQVKFTVFLVVLRFNLLFLAAVESVLDMSYRVRRRERTVKEVTCTRLLHYVSARVAAQLAESVVAEDDRLVVNLSVGDHEVAICKSDNLSITSLGLAKYGWDV